MVVMVPYPAGTTASGERCIFTRSYTEGSSWMAYQAIDEFFAGPAILPDQPNYPKTDEGRYINHHDFSIPFIFGCQISETGLFVTQLARRRHDGHERPRGHAA